MVKIYFLLMLHVHCRLAAGPLCVVFILGWDWWRKLYGTRSLLRQREKQRSWGSTYRLLKLPPGSYTSHFCSHFIVQSMQNGPVWRPWGMMCNPSPVGRGGGGESDRAAVQSTITLPPLVCIFLSGLFGVFFSLEFSSACQTQPTCLCCLTYLRFSNI